MSVLWRPSVCVCVFDSPAKGGVTVRSWRCCVQRRSRAGPAGWRPSDSSKYFLYLCYSTGHTHWKMLPVGIRPSIYLINSLFLKCQHEWICQHFEAWVNVVSPPPQYGIVLYQSYNIPQQRKSNLLPFSAPVVRIHSLTSLSYTLMPPLCQDQSTLIHQSADGETSSAEIIF